MPDFENQQFIISWYEDREIRQVSCFSQKDLLDTLKDFLNKDISNREKVDYFIKTLD